MLRFDDSRTGIPHGNNFNDKESPTADRTDSVPNPNPNSTDEFINSAF